MKGLFHLAIRVWTFLVKTHIGEGSLKLLGSWTLKNPCARGHGSESKTLMGLEQWGQEDRGRLSSLLTWPPPLSPSPTLGTHVFGIKGIVAAAAELVTTLGAVEVHAASSGQCIRELALRAVCKGQ